MEAPEARLLAVKWAEEQLRRIEDESKVTVHNLFVGFMYALSKFVISHGGGSKDLNETGLFEVGCYFYSAVDLWLFRNKPDLRERISSGLYDRFVSLYSEIFDMEKPVIGKISNQRISKYGELYRSDFPDMKKISWNLSQVIMISKRKTKPEFYNFEKGPLILNAF